MSRAVLYAGMLIAVAWLPVSADPTAQVAVAAQPALEDRYPRASVSFDNGIAGHPDLVFSTIPGFRPLRLDLYLPAGLAPAKGRPLVIYIHGGGWQSGHTRHAGAFADWPAVLASLAARGYVVASIEYRLSAEAKFPAAIQDVKSAIRWLRWRSAEYGIDRDRTVLWGGSAGGQLAALAAASCGVQAVAPVFYADGRVDPGAPQSRESDCVQGLVAWYAVFDFATAPMSANQRQADSPVSKYLGCAPTDCVSTAALASPLTHVSQSTPPSLLIHGELDKVVPVSQSKDFYARLQQKKIPSELMVIAGVDHSFIGSDAAATREASLAALAKTFEFIDATLGSKRP